MKLRNSTNSGYILSPQTLYSLKMMATAFWDKGAETLSLLTEFIGLWQRITAGAYCNLEKASEKACSQAMGIAHIELFFCMTMLAWFEQYMCECFYNLPYRPDSHQVITTSLWKWKPVLLLWCMEWYPDVRMYFCCWMEVISSKVLWQGNTKADDIVIM